MLTKRTLALLIAAPLAAGTATYAAAQGDHPSAKDTAGDLGGDPSARPWLQKFDRNGDGKLDDAERAQMKAALAAKRAERQKERLAKYDANQDGTLDDTERTAMRDDRLTERFQAMDANHDGTLTLEEFKTGAQAGHHRHGRRHHARTHGTTR